MPFRTTADIGCPTPISLSAIGAVPFKETKPTIRDRAEARYLDKDFPLASPPDNAAVERVDLSMSSLSPMTRASSCVPEPTRTPQLHITRGGVPSLVQTQPKHTFLGEVWLPWQEQIQLFKKQFLRPPHQFPGNIARYLGDAAAFSAGEIERVDSLGYFDRHPDDKRSTLVIPLGSLTVAVLGEYFAYETSYEFTPAEIAEAAKDGGKPIVRYIPHEHNPLESAGLNLDTYPRPLKSYSGALGLAVADNTKLIRVRWPRSYAHNPEFKEDTGADPRWTFLPMVLTLPEEQATIQNGRPTGATTNMVAALRERIAQANNETARFE